jgi:biotin carboxyl carrier protein
LKLQVEVDGQEYVLVLERNGGHSEYRLQGAQEASGTASVTEVMPGVFSVLLGEQSFRVYVSPNGDGLEVWTGGTRYTVAISDPRDRSGAGRKHAASGPVEVRSQMPGKIVKVLVEPGAEVTAGQGLIVVEAMKMQNEMKSPKDGRVARILAVEGGTVGAGETLVVVE